MFPIHKDDTGFFQELAHKKSIDFGQLSILGINPGCSRGGHYHERKTEWFCCIKASCILNIINVKTEETKKYSLFGSERLFVKVEPYESHTLYNFPDNPNCEVLIIISEEFDSKDPDTFKYEEDEL